MTGNDLPLLAARAELNRRGDPTIDWLDYIRNAGLDVPTICRFAGLLAVTHCIFYDHGRFDFADPAEREAEAAAVIEALGDDAATTIDLVAWPIEAPDRFGALYGDVSLLGVALRPPSSSKFLRVVDTRRAGSIKRGADKDQGETNGYATVCRIFVPHRGQPARRTTRAKDRFGGARQIRQTGRDLRKR
jgi:hypothetical protein